MLRSVRLVNLRSLGDTGDIELRPLVVLVGANSSGKSTLLRFFPLLRQTSVTPSSSPLLWFGDDVDFGDFRQAVRGHDTSRTIEVGLRINGALRETRVYAKLAQDAKGETFVRQFVLAMGAFRARLGFDERNSLRDLRIGEPITIPAVSDPGSDVTFSMTSLVPVPEDEGAALMAIADEALKQLINSRVHANTSWDTILWIRDQLKFGDDAEVLRSIQGACAQLKGQHQGLVSINGEPDALAALRSWLFLRELPGWLREAHATLRADARSVHYIGPFRSEPSRYYRQQSLAIDSLARDGSNLAMLLRALDGKTRRDFSAWLQRYFGFGVDLQPEGAHVALHITEPGGGRFNLVDTGFGLSQLLPIAAQAWLETIEPSGERRQPGAEAARALAIEQPELHLHPRHQAQLADMFAGLVGALKDVGRECPVVVETHSEALINRLGELIHEKKLGPEDVSVLVFERDESGTTQVRRSEFDDQGVLQNWPLGFFLA